MADIRRIVLDVLKPHQPSLVTFADRTASAESVEGVTVSLIEMDREVQNVAVAIEGEALEYDAIEETIEGLGGTVHSIDQVTCGEHVVEEQRSPRDG